MYDLLIVGAGITAATLVASLKDRLRICVIDCRSHFAGNCFDEKSDGTMIHRYGPHIFHCPSPRIVEFLSQFTDWIPYSHRVLAEVREGSEFKYVPFPYSKETERQLGRKLCEREILDTFYRGYSQKMWGIDWDSLPSSVRSRLPTEQTENSVYYPGHFVATPKWGYAHMIAAMFDGAELILGAPASEWTRIAAQTVIYTGRPDLIPVPGEMVPIAQREQLQLGFRTLDIEFGRESWSKNCACINACTLERKWTRKTCFRQMTGGESQVVSTEFPRQALDDETSPCYPIQIAANQRRFAELSEQIHGYYPHLHLAGRLGSYRYFDMYHAFGQALALGERLWKK